MPVTRHPPHRSVRAELPHTAPALSDGESYIREFMAYPEVRNIDIYDWPEPFPRHGSSFLTSAPQAPVPRFDNLIPEAFQGVTVARNTKVVPVSLHDSSQPDSCLIQWCMHLFSQACFDVLKCLALSFAFGLAFQKVAAFPGPAAQVREPEEVEALGFTFSPFLPPFGGIPSEFYQPGFPGVQGQAIGAQPFFQGFMVSLGFRFVLETQHHIIGIPHDDDFAI